MPKIPYDIGTLTLLNLHCKKVSFDLHIQEDDFYELMKTSYSKLSAQAADFMILWDEDPYSLPFGESRCYIAVADPSPPLLVDKPSALAGKYAMFDTSAFDRQEMDIWHNLAFLLLELDNVDMRVSTFVEYYSPDALEHIDNFYPNRIALPIE